jgi:hypothetical protein
MLADFYVVPPIVTIGGQIPSRTYTCNVKYTRISVFKSDLLRLCNFFVKRLGKAVLLIRDDDLLPKHDFMFRLIFMPVNMVQFGSDGLAYLICWLAKSPRIYAHEFRHLLRISMGYMFPCLRSNARQHYMHLDVIGLTQAKGLSR